jgi:putative Flp pilus-assembly TadE/G-like protein
VIRSSAGKIGGFARREKRSRKRGRCEDARGQVVVFVLLSLLVFLGMAGFVVDIGYAYFAQRSLQASADAAALAGAQELPDASAAAVVAEQYGGEDGAKNENENVQSVTTTVTTKCLASAPGCDPVNAVVVEEAAEIDTIFAKVLGIDSFDVDVRAVACSPCGAKPLDIMLVLDRTGSMCQDHWGNNDSSCTDLNNARNGMKTFLGLLDPATDWVGFAVFPPATSLGTKCNTPASSNYDSTSSKYVIVPLSSNYKVNGVLNTSSNLVSTINCQKGGGTTAYANAIEHAQVQLNSGGRPDVQDVIVFLSDGAANTGPTYYSTTSPYRKKPCHQGVSSSGTVKAGGTLVFSIGYDLNALNGGANKCQSYTGADESPAITAFQALEQIATDAESFYNQPNPGQLNTIFSRVAADISRPAARLVDEDF